MLNTLKKMFGSKRSEDLAAAGVSQPAVQSPPQSLSELKQSAESQIDDFMKKVGITDPSSLTDENGWRYFKLGSAEGRAGVIEIDGEIFLRVEAPVMPLPSDNELIVPLMRELLELNLTVASLARAGIQDNMVFVAVMRPIAQLTSGDFELCIHSVMTIADGIDDIFIEKYGGTSKKRSPAK